MEKLRRASSRCEATNDLDRLRGEPWRPIQEDDLVRDDQGHVVGVLAPADDGPHDDFALRDLVLCGIDQEQVAEAMRGAVATRRAAPEAP